MQIPLGTRIAEMLFDRGIRHIFGIPGVHNQELYRGIETAGLTHVLARHEQGAGFMADGYARATGSPAIAFVITGPGLCNIMTPMGQASSDSVPMLVLSSCLDETEAVKGQLHQMKDQRIAAETVCDWSRQAASAEEAFALIDEALSECASERPRAKHVQLPIAMLEGPAPAPPERPEPNRLDGPTPAELSQAVKLLAAANRPVFIFGGGVKGHVDPGPLLTQTGALCLTTYAGRGRVAQDHPHHLGAFLARPGCADLLSEADLVVAVGTELAEVDLWRPDLGTRCPMIRVDLDNAVLEDRYAAETAIRSDAAAFLRALSAECQSRAAKPFQWGKTRVDTLKTRWRAEVDAERPGLLPVIDTIRNALPEQAMIYSDMTEIAYAAKEVWLMRRPHHWHHPTGFGTLGYALPAAIGGKIGRPDIPVVALAGDYGLQYTMPELAVATELGLSLPILVWDNDRLGEIEASMTRAQIAPNAVRQRNPDFLALARAFGANACAPNSLASLSEAVSEALDCPCPTLVRMTPAMLESTIREV